ncbi:hypothetical protein ACFL6I_09615 [candidate division KSB1 bacterium]
MYGLNKKELDLFKKLNTPRKIQDFLERLKVNFENDTCFSPRTVLKKKKAHCIEAAMFAAAALRIHGHKPLLLDLTSVDKDEDHVVAVFKQYGHWGAISKSNHAVLRYRDPVYKSIRELVMSYFNEYFLNNRKKTLRSYTNPLDLSIFDNYNWMINEEDMWEIPIYLAEMPHKKILNRAQLAALRKVDPIEVKAGDIEKWSKRKKRKISKSAEVPRETFI